MAVVRISAPATTPVTTAEAKTHLRVSHSDDDTYIAALVDAATKHVEEYTRRSLITQTWEVRQDMAPVTAAIELPRPPTVSVSHVHYFTADGTETEFDSTFYELDDAATPGRLWLKRGYSWPSGLRDYDSFVVRYVAGYGASGSSVPTPIRQAILGIVAELYEQRQWSITGTIVAQTIFGPMELLRPYRVLYF